MDGPVKVTYILKSLSFSFLHSCPTKASECGRQFAFKDKLPKYSGDINQKINAEDITERVRVERL